MRSYAPQSNASSKLLALNQAINLILPWLTTCRTAAGSLLFRNRLIHAYAAVSNEIVWGIVEAYLPSLRVEIRRLLEMAS